MRWLAPGAVALLLTVACGGQPNAPSAGTTINFWYLSSGAQDAAKAFRAAHPDIDVKATKISSLPSSLTGANAPDVVELNRDWIAAVASPGALHEFSTHQDHSLGGKSALLPHASPTAQ